MLMTRTLSSPIPLVALQPILHLVRRHARERRSSAVYTSGRLYDDATQRMYAASEMSLALLVDHTLTPLIEPLPEGPVDVAEQIQLAVSALYTFVTSATPPDVVAPLLSVHTTRRCLVSAERAVLLVQLTLATLLAGLVDDALHFVVAMPRQEDGGVCIEIQTDVPGIMGQSEEALSARAQIEQVLAESGGAIQLVHQDGCWIAAVRLFPERSVA